MRKLIEVGDKYIALRDQGTMRCKDGQPLIVSKSTMVEVTDVDYYDVIFINSLTNVKQKLSKDEFRTFFEKVRDKK